VTGLPRGYRGPRSRGSLILPVDLDFNAGFGLSLTGFRRKRWASMASGIAGMRPRLRPPTPACHLMVSTIGLRVCFGLSTNSAVRPLQVGERVNIRSYVFKHL
jgi:hypothetical protein